MTNAKDIIFESDLVIKNGDFEVDESDGQHIMNIIQADRGQFRQWPLVGVGILKYQSASVDPQALKQEIKLQLKADNMRVTSLTVVPGENLAFSVDAERLK